MYIGRIKQLKVFTYMDSLLPCLYIETNVILELFFLEMASDTVRSMG